MSQLTTHIYRDEISAGVYFLAGDIGGTNSNFGVISFEGEQPILLLSIHARSQEVASYVELVQHVCDFLWQNYSVRIQHACFGIAGIVQDHCRCVEPTNLDIKLDAQQITQETPIEELVIMNDFVAVATGIDHISQEDIISVLSGDGVPQANKAAIGAGTGLGKVSMVWHRPAGRYIPVASEGGHSDFAPCDIFDFAFAEYIRTQYNKAHPASWEDVLAGKGIRHIYQFLREQKAYPQTEVSREIASAEYTPDKISEYAKQDAAAQDTFELYARWTGRCAKNFVLETLAFNGVYIAGGIAAKNTSVFRSNAFQEAFYNSDVHIGFLRKTPVYVIADYNVSLYGAAAYYQLYKNNVV